MLFLKGGPDIYTGMSGRKLSYDTYGGYLESGCTEGISGRDPSNISKTALLYSRYIAKSLVYSGICHRVSI